MSCSIIGRWLSSACQSGLRYFGLRASLSCDQYTLRNPMSWMRTPARLLLLTPRPGTVATTTLSWPAAASASAKMRTTFSAPPTCIG